MIGRAHRWPLVALAILALTLVLRAAGSLAPFEHRAADARSRLLQRQVDSDIVLVGIDARSLADLQQWPWPRRYHARLLETIAAAEPRRVFVDVDFSAHTTAEDDALLEAALQRFDRSQIVLPAFLQPDEGVAGNVVYTRPLERLRSHATLGGVNFRPDDDGLIRSMATTWAFDDGNVPSAVALLAGSDSHAGRQRADRLLDLARLVHLHLVRGPARWTHRSCGVARQDRDDRSDSAGAHGHQGRPCLPGVARCRSAGVGRAIAA